MASLCKPPFRILMFNSVNVKNYFLSLYSRYVKNIKCINFNFFRVKVCTCIRIRLHDSDVIKTEKFFLVLLNIPCTNTDPWRQLKTLYYACQASSWRCHFVNKHYTPAHIHTSVDWKYNMHVHNVTIFTNLHFVFIQQYSCHKLHFFKSLHF